jgi:hypothetical protein
MVEPSLSGENSPPPYRLLGNMAEEEGKVANETRTFGFPILDMAKDIAMKNIPLSSLPLPISKPTSRGFTRIELGNLLENFKTDILHTISSN